MKQKSEFKKRLDWFLKKCWPLLLILIGLLFLVRSIGLDCVNCDKFTWIPLTKDLYSYSGIFFIFFGMGWLLGRGVRWIINERIDYRGWSDTQYYYYQRRNLMRIEDEESINGLEWDDEKDSKEKDFDHE